MSISDNLTADQLFEVELTAGIALDNLTCITGLQIDSDQYGRNSREVVRVLLDCIDRAEIGEHDKTD